MAVIEAGILAAIPKDVATTKGDLVVATASATIARQGVGSNGQVLTADSAVTNGLKWATPSTVVSYTKTTAKAVNTTTTATDLLNAEITIAAGVMGTAGMCRLTAWGDLLWNVAANPAVPRFQLVLGGTTLLDTGTGSGAIPAASATRGSWRIVCEIQNLGAANSQMSNLSLLMYAPAGFSTSTFAAFTTGQGGYSAGGTGAQIIYAIAQGTNPSTAVDTATSKTLVLNVINGVSNAAYETKLLGAKIEIV